MSLSVKTQGIKGTEPKYKSNLGYVSIFKDGLSQNMISIDNYEGFGDSYKKREDPEINIQIDGKIMFTGTFEELKKKLQNK